MIAQLRGTLIEKTHSEAVVDCGGVGYAVSISLATYEQLPELDGKIQLFTHLIPGKMRSISMAFRRQPSGKHS